MSARKAHLSACNCFRWTISSSCNIVLYCLVLCVWHTIIIVLAWTPISLSFHKQSRIRIEIELFMILFDYDYLFLQYCTDCLLLSVWRTTYVCPWFKLIKDNITFQSKISSSCNLVPHCFLLFVWHTILPPCIKGLFINDVITFGGYWD